MGTNDQHAVGVGVAAPRRPTRRQPDRLSDEALLGQVTRGERAAFEELYDRFVAPVHGLVLAVVQDAERTAEVVTELFVDLWTFPWDLATTRGPVSSRFATRILAEAHRRAVQSVRLRRQCSTMADAPDQWVSQPAARLLDGVSDPEALTAIGLAYFDARTLGEIAGRLEVSPTRVAGLLSRGLEDLCRSSPAR